MTEGQKQIADAVQLAFDARRALDFEEPARKFISQLLAWREKAIQEVKSCRQDNVDRRNTLLAAASTATTKEFFDSCYVLAATLQTTIDRFPDLENLDE